jgi:hypothetical protein
VHDGDVPVFGQLLDDQAEGVKAEERPLFRVVDLEGFEPSTF